jgi:hypothetical protein
MTTLRRLSVVVLAIVAINCSPSSSVPDGLSFSIQTDTRVEGSFAQGGDSITFVATVNAADREHSDVTIRAAGGIVLHAADGRVVRLGSVELAHLDEAGVAAVEPEVEAFLASAQAELISQVFRNIDTPTAELSAPMSALYATSSALETGVSGTPLTAEPPPEARACWNKCCGTDCDCYHYNPCSWWDPTCNYCAHHDACIHYYRDHLGWSNALATAWCT